MENIMLCREEEEEVRAKGALANNEAKLGP